MAIIGGGGDNPTRRPARSGRSSAKSAEGKAAQRARNKAAGNVTSSGSSGSGKLARQMQRVEFADIEQHLIHICDIGGKLNTVQSTAGGAIMGTIYTSPEYAGDLLDAQLESLGAQATYIRIYRLPMSVMIGTDD